MMLNRLRNIRRCPRANFSRGMPRFLSRKEEIIDPAVEKQIKEDSELMYKEFVNYTKNPKDIAEALAEQREGLHRDYKEFYDTLQKDGGYSIYTEDFTKLPQKEQAAQEAYRKAFVASATRAMEKFGRDADPFMSRIAAYTETAYASELPPLRVCVTGASGQLGYALVFRIASGAVFGLNQPIILSLLELPQAMNALNGVVMELKDCAFPLIRDIVATDSADHAFSGVDYALLVGAAPRGKGMERADLLQKNASIFQAQGKALNSRAKGMETRVIVVGNPANTNALIASHNAPSIPRENFSAMMRLDHNRALFQLADHAKCSVRDIERFVVWGNHSATQFPDISHATIKGKLATEVVTDQKWLKDVFIPGVQNRGKAIIDARGLSSAASAANATCDAAADVHFGTYGRWTSHGVCSDGSYGVTKGLFYGFPVVYNQNREWDIVRDLPIDEASAARMEATHKELLEERDAVASFLVR